MTSANSVAAAQPMSLAQRIWLDANCLVLIFAGGSAEFAVHPNVDWLFFTGKLPADPIERFFSTIDYLRRMLVLSPEERAPLARALRGLHGEVEERRGDRIPDVAYRDVLSMDIYYSIVAADLVFAKQLTADDKDDVVQELVLFGHQMGIPDLPVDYAELCEFRRQRFTEYGVSEFTSQLLQSYRKALGLIGFHSLLGTYPLLLEPELQAILPLKTTWLTPVARHGLKPLCRTGLIKWAYRIGLPKRLANVVANWQTSCRKQDIVGGLKKRPG